MKINLTVDERDTRFYGLSGDIDGVPFEGKLKRELGYAKGTVETKQTLSDLAKVTHRDIEKIILDKEAFVPFADEDEPGIVPLSDEEVFGKKLFTDKENEVKELRMKAKEAGIKNWHNKKVENIIMELGKVGIK